MGGTTRWIELLTCSIILTGPVFTQSAFALPQDLDPIGFWPHGACLTVDVDDPMVYFSLGSNLVSANFSDPANPVFLDALHFPLDSLTDVEFLADQVHIAINGVGYRLVEVGSRGALSLVGGVPGTAPHGLGVDDTYAYVADAADGLRVIRHDSPIGPYEVTLFDQGELQSSSCVDVVGSMAYVGTANGLSLLDISSPANPMQLGFYTTPGLVADVQTIGDQAFMTRCCEWALECVGVGNPNSPHWDAEYSFVGGMANAVAVQLPHVYVTDGNRLHILELWEPDFFPISQFDTAGDTRDVVVSHRRAYVADGKRGLAVIDVNDPAMPFEIGRFDVPDGAFTIVRSGDYAYYAGWDGVWVLDINDRAAPKTLGEALPPERTYDLELGAGYLVAASVDMGLVLLDLADATQPSIVSSGMAGSAVEDIAVDGDLVYVASTDGMAVVDLSPPLNLMPVGTIDVGRCIGATVEGRYVYALGKTGDAGELKVIDVLDPASPVLVSSTPTSDYPDCIASRGNHVFVGSRVDGLEVFDVSNPAAPTLVATYSAAGGVHDLALHGAYALMAADALHAINIRNLDNLWEVAVAEECERVFSVWADDEMILTGGPTGMWTLLNSVGVGVQEHPRLSAPARLGRAFPNPFNPGVTVSFELKESRSVTLSIYDVAGRLVRTMESGRVFSAGNHEIQWWGVDDRGRSVASGTYVCHLTVGDWSDNIQLTLVK